MVKRTPGNLDSQRIQSRKTGRDPSVRIARRNNGTERTVPPPSGQQRMGSNTIPQGLTQGANNVEAMRGQISESVNKGTPVEGPVQTLPQTIPQPVDNLPEPRENVYGGQDFNKLDPNLQTVLRGLVLRRIIKEMEQ